MTPRLQVFLGPYHSSWFSQGTKHKLCVFCLLPELPEKRNTDKRGPLYLACRRVWFSRHGTPSVEGSRDVTYPTVVRSDSLRLSDLFCHPPPPHKVTWDSATKVFYVSTELYFRK